jgi:hypothetical protein
MSGWRYLVFEVYVTSPSLDKLPIFAQVGVAEVWRHAGERMEMFGLRREELRYEAIAESNRPATPDERRARALRRRGLEDEASSLGTWCTRVGAEPCNSASAWRRLVHPEVPSVSAMASGTHPNRR